MELRESPNTIKMLETIIKFVRQVTHCRADCRIVSWGIQQRKVLHESRISHCDFLLERLSMISLKCNIF